MHRAFTISVRENDLQNLKEEPTVEYTANQSVTGGTNNRFLALIAGSHEAACAAKRKVISVTGLMVDRWSVSDVTAKFMRPQRHTRRQPNDSP